MSKVARFLIGAALIVAGILTGNVMLIVQGGAIIASAFLMPKGPARNASEMAISLGEQPRVALFGETATPGSLIDGFNWGGKYGTKWEGLIIRLADHKCESLTGFYVNDEWVDYTGDGPVDGYNGDLEIYVRLNTSTQPLPDLVTDHGPGWDTGYYQGESGCDIFVAYQADKPDEKNPEWPGGRPRFLFVLKGKKCYDPRQDDTVPGGSGDHRWDDPATWEWTDNAAVCRYNWVRGIYANDQVENPSQLLVGRGLTAAEAPPENIIAPANLCDETVNAANRYTVAGPVYSQQPFIEVEEMFAAATGGTVITREGSVELEPGQAKSVVATIYDTDLVVGSEVSWNQGILSESNQEWVNTVVARYVEPTQKWADHAAPVVREAVYIHEDGKPREQQLTLRLVSDTEQAQRVAQIALRMGRLWGRATITLPPRFCELEDGDWIRWISARYDFDLTFRIDAYSVNEKWHNTLTLRQIHSDVYSDLPAIPDFSEPQTPTEPPPEIGTPDPDNWTLSAITLDSAGASVPALHIQGDTSDDELVESIIFEYWKDDAVGDPVADPDSVAWTQHGGNFPPSTTQTDITSVQGGATYYAAVTYVVDGEPGDRLVLGPVTLTDFGVTEFMELEDDATPYSLEDGSTLVHLG